VYRAAGRIESADSLLERAANMDGATPEELVAQAAPLYARASEDPEARATAMQILVRVLEMDARNADALVMLGDLHVTEGKFGEAADLLYRALDVNPRDPQLWVQTAGAFLQAGERERTVEVTDEGLLLFPGFLPLLRLSGYALMDAYRNREAIGRFEEAVGIIREDQSESETELADLLGALALLYTRTKDMEAADQAYREAIETDPNNAGVLNNYAYSLAEQGKELGRALELAQRAVELSPETAPFLDTLGWTYFKKGDHEKAIRFLRKATEAGGASTAVYEHLGDVLNALGDPAGADEAWNTALRMNPDSSSLRQKLGRE
jgi:tetratricopeptide (TPR) repeat protein